MMNKMQKLTSPVEETEFIEALLASKGIMFIKNESCIFPFDDNYKGFVYTYSCDTFTHIQILMLLNQITK